MGYLIHLLFGEESNHWYGLITVASQMIALMTIPSVLFVGKGSRERRSHGCWRCSRCRRWEW